MTTTTTRRDGPGLARLRKAANAEKAEAAEAIDLPANFVLGRAAHLPAQALELAAAPSAAADAKRPPTARAAKARPHFQRGVAIEPTPVPEPAESMPGMSKANAAKYLDAARGVMPTPPDFSKPSYAPNRKRLAELVALAETGDAAALRAYAIKTYYTSAVELDRFRHRAILAIEARTRIAAAA
jgi:hypothetical protein